MGKENGIFERIRTGDCEGLEALLKANPALRTARDDRGVSAVMTALYHFREDMARLLAEGREDLDFWEAAAMGNENRVKALLGEDESLLDRYSPDGFTALQYTAFFNRPGVLRMLLERGADSKLQSQNQMSLTALHSAAARGSLEMTELLLANGAEVNARQQMGYTALMSAAHQGNRALVELLLQNGADASLTSQDGKTAESLAREKGDEALAELVKG